MARKSVVFDESDEGFTEVKPRSGHKLSLSIGDSGIDWSSDEERQQFVSVLGDDPDFLEAIADKLPDDDEESDGQVITEQHLNGFLDFVEAMEQFFIPRMVARKSIGGLAPGQFKIDPDVAKAAFTFENRDKLVPCGVKAANAHLPEKIKAIISKVGPGSEFVGRFLQELRAQQIRAITLQVQKMQRVRQAHPGSPPVRAAGTVPPQRPNGSPSPAPAEARVPVVEEQTA